MPEPHRGAYECPHPDCENSYETPEAWEDHLMTDHYSRDSAEDEEEEGS